MTTKSHGRDHNRELRKRIKAAGVKYARVAYLPEDQADLNKAVETFRKRAKDAVLEYTGGPVKGRDADGKFVSLGAKAQDD